MIENSRNVFTGRVLTLNLDGTGAAKVEAAKFDEAIAALDALK